jgi:hypothetical protein
MELVLSNPPAAGYNAGDNVSGLLKYNIASEQETVYDVCLNFDGSVMINPTKFKYETHRSHMTLIEESRTLFQGPFTMKRQLLVWPFSFTIPATAITGGLEVPLPPTMDFLFREGLRVSVKYNITATIRFGLDHIFGKQETRVVYVKPSTNIATLRRYSGTISFPTMEFQTNGELGLPRSSIWDFFSRPEIVSPTLRQTLHLEMKLPSALLYDQQEHVTLCLSGTTEAGNTLSDPKFIIETFELVLRSRLIWQNHLQIRRHIGTLTMRPGTEIDADGQFVSLPDTFQLQDFAGQRETPLLQSYDSVIPEVSFGFTLAAIVVLRHKTSRRHLILRASFPVVLHGSTASNLFPPAYRDHEALEESGPPPYAQ